MMVKGTHYSHDCNCKSCKQVVINMPETKNIIEEIDRIFNDELYESHSFPEIKCRIKELKAFLLSGLQALKEEIIYPKNERKACDVMRQHAKGVFERFGIK
jgi:hypothetical protein